MGAQEIIIGIGGVIVHHNPVILTSLGLGSCVGVCLYDAQNNIGGLAHVMLPDSKEYSGKVHETRELDKLHKYADVAIPFMIREMEKLGAKKMNIHAKIAGGSQMFATLSDNFSIGKRNIESIKKVLQFENIPIDAEDIGGNMGRSIRFDTSTRKVNIKSINGIKEI